MFCSIGSVTSYFSEKKAKNLQNGDVHIAQIPEFEMEYLENHLAPKRMRKAPHDENSAIVG